MDYTGVFRCPGHQVNHSQEMKELCERMDRRVATGEERGSEFRGKRVLMMGKH